MTWSLDAVTSTSMTVYGATQFAPRMAELIISEVKFGAVHYA